MQSTEGCFRLLTRSTKNCQKYSTCVTAYPRDLCRYDDCMLVRSSSLCPRQVWAEARPYVHYVILQKILNYDGVKREYNKKEELSRPSTYMQIRLRVERTLYSEKKYEFIKCRIFFSNEHSKFGQKMDNPFKRYDFSKFSSNSVKSLCRPHKLATVPCHGCTTPHW